MWNVIIFLVVNPSVGGICFISDQSDDCTKVYPHCAAMHVQITSSKLFKYWH